MSESTGGGASGPGQGGLAPGEDEGDGGEAGGGLEPSERGLNCSEGR